MKSYDFAALANRLNSAVLSDVLDEIGLTNQAMLPYVRPLDDGLAVFGRARTGLYMNTYSVEEHGNPYEVEIALVDDLKPGDIAVLACDGPTARIAPWGELLTTASRMRGAVGCVTDGLVRDVRLIRDLQFPVFAGGIGPLDSKGRGKMMAMDVPVTCGGAPVRSGDLVFGDVDGVVVIPADVADRVIEAAVTKLESESMTRAELLNGALLAEVYARYGVL
ncbi:RraA family protein [Mesorhizobium marinum]|uniref:RraA family protein n=1 Tax=Mesorhizobium marinum TaxID=3228790 RepID=UPI003465A37B